MAWQRWLGGLVLVLAASLQAQDLPRTPAVPTMDWSAAVVASCCPRRAAWSLTLPMASCPTRAGRGRSATIASCRTAATTIPRHTVLWPAFHAHTTCRRRSRSCRPLNASCNCSSACPGVRSTSCGATSSPDHLRLWQGDALGRWEGDTVPLNRMDDELLEVACLEDNNDLHHLRDEYRAAQQAGRQP